MSFADLPKELWVEVITFMVPTDVILGLGLTASAFHELCELECVWKLIATRLDLDLSLKTSNTTWKTFVKEYRLRLVLPSFYDGQVELSNQGLTARHTSQKSGGHILFHANRPWRHGKHYFEVTLDHTEHQIFVGIIPFQRIQHHYVGGGYGWSCCPYYAFAQGQGTDKDKVRLGPLWRRHQDGDVIGVEVDLDNGDLSFWLNNKFLGTPYQNSSEILRSKPICAAASVLIPGEQCTFNFSPAIIYSAVNENPLQLTKWQ
ncbi:hypothetical protein QOT17_019234 [Balamuthia mandrillaris]